MVHDPTVMTSKILRTGKFFPMEVIVCSEIRLLAYAWTAIWPDKFTQIHAVLETTTKTG